MFRIWTAWENGKPLLGEDPRRRPLDPRKVLENLFGALRDYGYRDAADLIYMARHPVGDKTRVLRAFLPTHRKVVQSPLAAGRRS